MSRQIKVQHTAIYNLIAIVQMRKNAVINMICSRSVLVIFFTGYILYQAYNVAGTWGVGIFAVIETFFVFDYTQGIYS